MEKQETLLAVKDLHTHFETERGRVQAVNGVSFELKRGERLAVVGESGSGKSAMAMSLLQLLSYPGKVVAGSVKLEGHDLLQMSERQLNEVRGGAIGTVFQDPMTSLDPVMTVEDQLVYTMRRHMKMDRKPATQRAVELLGMVGIPDPEVRVKNYPYELSGGMRQRVLIAMALSCNPKLILADEPTTALDVTIQAQIIGLLKDLSVKTGCAMLFITHDLGLVARFAQKVAVMYAGKIVEYGTVQEIFANPQHPYTQSLLNTIPRADGLKRKRLLQIEGFPPDMRLPIQGCSFKDRCPAATALCGKETPALTSRSDTHSAACLVEGGMMKGAVSVLQDEEACITVEHAPRIPKSAEPVLEIKSLKKHFETSSFFKKKRVVRAVDGIDISLLPGETLGVVGESGCGKSTMARLLLRLEEPSDGNIFVDGVDIAHLKGDELYAYRSKVQMVFQDPYSSFNPKITIRQIIGEPLNVRKIGTAEEREKRICELILTVGLDTAYLDRYPGQLSGGQRQRIGIARALALSPSIIVADEPTSALDVSVRAQVINLLVDLREKLGISIVFISHDLSVVRHISDNIVVMYLGKVVEFGPAAEVFSKPKHPYTKALLLAAPLPDPGLEENREIELLKGELPSPANPPKGCRFSTRCPIAADRCREELPELDPAGGSRKVACFFAS
ncbi:ABC transporter ATP-binding protein [Paenibacillus sp. S150]|uniref:ABC transporter ATP-binding protein n=1 Tax=Paenibacillus sp. S150 TaxID=2749826 RepID=UPI001C569C55|nr:ABC transporter ATP-binding protein [Paenibacillus sp. S150]MBW4084951.1 ABC transporter ATP-binding protein [Paenibacillus sp. S150]